MATTVRVHTVTSTAPVPNWGTESCDFRGANFIGDNEGDHHATREEWDVPDDSPLVIACLEEGPAVNSFFHKVWQNVTAPLPAEAAALVPHIRVGCWDKIAPGN